ncbi:NADH/NAD ratio-sensing transcriptional regulator Rex [Clostridium acetobutylicum]|nr:NADH/NAD ratio-sensing transcriptional regulator Rex [Clostridium acetobutylicum]
MYNTIIIGAGNIGQAIANYINFQKMGFDLKAIFDINPKLIGLKIQDVEVRDVDNIDGFLQKNKIDIGIICVPSKNAQKVCDIIVKNNVNGIWNFAPVDLMTPENVIVENVHLSESLLTLSCLLQEVNKSRD